MQWLPEALLQADWGFVIWFPVVIAREYVEELKPYVDLYDGFPGRGGWSGYRIFGVALSKPESAPISYNPWTGEMADGVVPLTSVEPGDVFEAVIIAQIDWRAWTTKTLVPMVGWGPVDRSREPDTLRWRTEPKAAQLPFLRPPDQNWVMSTVDSAQYLAWVREVMESLRRN